MSYVPILHLTVPAIWVSVLLAAVLASVLQRLLGGQKTGDWFWNAVALYILTWKLSYILFEFGHFVNMPLSLLYFNGGLPGHLLGIALVSIYLVRAHNKQPLVSQQASFSVLLFFLSYQMILQSFERDVLEAVLHGLLLVTSIASIWLLKERTAPVELLLTVLFTLELLILSAFGPLFTWQNATLILLATVTIYLYMRFHRKDRLYD